MLFLAKSAACIGLVAAVASGVGTDGVAVAISSVARAAAERAGSSCLQSDPCRHAGVGAMAASAIARAADLVPAADPTRPTKPARPAGG